MTQTLKRVQLLDPLVAERIAAGEVIERPASVVKELVENAIDAGATEIQIVLEEGGKNLIEVTDNGSGIAADDLRLAVQRHATSKIRALDDLLALNTLGFRGEALPSVAAVSELQILSRVHGNDTAYEWSSQDPQKAITHGTFISSPHGTRIRSIGLFSQIPVRLKFLKSSGAEVSHVREWIERLAIARPDVGFTLKNDEKTLISFRPGSLEDRLLQIMADGERFPVLKREGYKIKPDIRVSAYWLQGLSLPHTKKLIQVVNGRVLKDRLLQQAALHPFRQSLLPGQFPALFIQMEIDPAEIDVNVHPTKTEVRFRDSSKVFMAVQETLSQLIEIHGSANVLGVSEAFTAFAEAGASATSNDGIPTSWSGGGSLGFQMPTYQESFQPVVPQGPELKSILFNTYLVTEKTGECWVIDQHAAHERIRYEELKKKFFKSAEHGLEKQALLIPETVKVTVEQKQSLQERIDEFDKLGFEAEWFGEESLMIRAIPSTWETHDLKARIKNLVERLLETESEKGLLWDESLFEKLAMQACRSSLRAGDRINEFQANELIDRLMSCEHPWNCPHGRPTVVKIPEAKFEEWFHRRV